MKCTHQRPRTRRSSSSSLLSFTLLAVGTAFILTTTSAPAKATRLTRTAVAIKNLKLSLPMPIEQVAKPNFLGLDLEDESQRKTLVKQATNYLEIRKGRLKDGELRSWLDKCVAQIGTDQEDPFCRYENERRKALSASRGSSSSVMSSERSAIVADLKSGRFEKVTSRTHQEVLFAVSSIEREGALPELAKKVVETNGCVAASVPAAIGYKLEEKFPEQSVIEDSKKLYAKASKCGDDYPAALASYRLALIHLWQGNCEEVPQLMGKVEATKEASMLHSRAIYWRYHCANVKKNLELSKSAREELLREHPLSFQNLAANGNDEVAMSQILRSSDPQVAVRSLVRPDLNGIIRGSEAMIRAGHQHIATEMIERNLNDIQGLEPEVRLYVAILLHRMEQALPKFKVLTSLFQDVPSMVSNATMKLYYPLWYYEQVKEKQNHVDPLLIISLIRQESAFNSNARSIAGARGLMQVMPATARSVASVRKNQLYDVGTNISVGTKYFLKRLQQYDGDVELTLAAYNAGFARVDEWRKRYPTDNKMLFLDFIPFRETRDYVSVILRNYYWYVKLYSNENAETSTEGMKLTSRDTKVAAIMNANAGAAAMLK